MAANTISGRRWSRQIILLSISLSVIGAFITWFVIYDDFWKSWRQNSMEEIFEDSPLQASKSGKLIDSASLSRSSSGSQQPQISSHQREAFVRPIKVGNDVGAAENVETIGTETAEGTEHRHWIWGTFRNHTAKFWDPNPEYTFEAFERRFHLVLEVNSALAEPDFKVTYVSKNYSSHQDPAVNPVGCFYSGSIKDDPLSEVSVSLCNGMRGYIISKTSSYYIKPAVEPPNDNSETFLHSVVPIEAERTSSAANGECGQRRSADHVPIPNFESSSFDDTGTSNNFRRRRSVDEFTIELMVVVDRTMVEAHKEDTQNYVMVLLSSLRTLFKDKGLGARINVELVNLTIFSDRDFRHMKGQNQTDLLNKFCAWQAKEKTKNHPNRRAHDTAILLTRDGFCEPMDYQCGQVIGFSYVGTICTNHGDHSCALVKDNGLFSLATLAHELGHLMGMQHDDHPDCNYFEAINGTIMARQMDVEPKPWVWSQCSKSFLHKFLRGDEEVKCLYNNPREAISLPSTSIGEIYDSDEQCQKIYGSDWIHCSLDDECKKLYCRDKAANNWKNCTTDHRPWADGTPCGDGYNYWCKRGQCVLKNRHIPVVHGEWGAWQQFGPCSRTCGGGVRKSVRKCNNPEPSEGGEWCKGPATQYESCNIQECPEGPSDFRAKQCASHNTEITSWYPVSSSRANRCQLVCKAANHDSTAFGLVTDGTPCSSSSFDICVDGKCVEAGCDHVIRSKSVLDKCGVCAGDNSTCFEVRNFYNITDPQNGYNIITIVPAGSWDLDIRQYSSSNMEDYNYLAIKDPDSNVYLLNGNSRVKAYSETFTRNGITFIYSGSRGGPPETLKSFSRLSKNLILEVLSTNDVSPFSIECRYKVPNSQKYQWEVTNEWSTCNKPCMGEQKQIIHCTKKETGNIVALESCDQALKPASKTRACNNYCYARYCNILLYSATESDCQDLSRSGWHLYGMSHEVQMQCNAPWYNALASTPKRYPAWKETTRSECSSHCGEGVQQVSYKCSQEFVNISISHQLPDAYCNHEEKPAASIPCYGPCHQYRWRYHDWEPCSVTCGTGVQKRAAVCVDNLNRPIDESMCAWVPKKTETACVLEECPHWSIGEWKSCSVSCGRGFRRRAYFCAQKNRAVANDLCPEHSRPSHTEPCQMAPCAHIWKTGEWSSCSVTCGIGVEYRSVWCSEHNEALCPQDKRPSETQVCRLPVCMDENDISPQARKYDRYDWQTGDWTECSASCGKGIKRRSVSCYNIKTKLPEDFSRCDDYKRPHDIEPCEKRSCAMWRTTPWSACSVTCGQGTRRRYAWCELNGYSVLHAKCTNPKPDELMSCDSRNPCAPVETTEAVEITPSTWRAGRWGECSVSCGGGTKIRNVVCLDYKGNASTRCEDHDRPASSSPCNTAPCPDQVKWKYGDWSECNQTCGGGYQHRQAQCQTLKGENVPDSYCSQTESPRLVRQCENSRCFKNLYQWRTSPWGACSVSCGSGFHSRTVICERVNEYQPAEREQVYDMLCNQATRPDASKECQGQPCRIDQFVYRWNSGPLSECSVTCGRGVQRRKVQCEKVDESRPNERELVPNNFCREADKPKHQLRCRRPCNTEYMWVSGPWSECKGPCGERIKVRTNQCYHRSGRPMVDIFCSRMKKPRTKKKCKNRKCEARSCVDIKRSYKTNIDRDYPIYILGRNISIYCHDMNTDQPKEFLSLPAGEMENYSEFYSKRLIDPNTCPASKHKCCIEETTPYVGKTYFRRIRLNVTSMEVMTTDFTFASTTGAWIPYGEAGDCYSRMNCPQGTFSINLAGTGLQISASVRWSEKGSYRMINVQVYHERRKIFGRCGGYCASCTTFDGLKLDVLPP